MKVLVLHSRMSGYMAACHRAAIEEYGCKVDLVAWGAGGSAPFDQRVCEHAVALYRREEFSDADLSVLASQGGYDAMVVSGWMDRGYVKASSAARAVGVVALGGCDTQWRGSMRQRARVALGRPRIRAAFDALWVPGDRQLEMARRLGLGSLRCWTGYYSADVRSFVGVRPVPSAKAFVFVGRLIDRKGIDVLLRAYRSYRNNVVDPWRLRILGVGPWEAVCRETDGVDVVGFVQPDSLPEELGRSSCFVLPSRFEAWGVAIHEAAAAGLPILCSQECGAGVHLVQDGMNGFKHATGRADELARHMAWVSGLSAAEWEACSAASRLLALQFSPSRWAATLSRAVGVLRELR